ncbi:MAG TPA: hypothetical protein VMH81_10410 [Bryobacteraceae bacterium]|nr:hypothetical protein [Bryobacteraceae bacterium]
MRTSKELAVVQLKALKLLVWIFVLRNALLVFRALVYAQIPPPLWTSFPRTGCISGPSTASLPWKPRSIKPPPDKRYRCGWHGRSGRFTL